MIRLENIKKVFHEGTVNENTALRSINLTVSKGDFITIVGSNGAGKSTLFNTISGSFSPTGGQIFFNNENVTRMAEYQRAKYIGRIFQDPLLGTASNMSLEDNMMICNKKGFKGLRVSLNSKMRERFRDELKLLQMGLEERMEHNLSLFSGGQRQALTLLMTVLSNPALILLDEHTAALDPKNAAMVLELTDKFISERKLTAMMITHNMSQAIKYGNRILMMHKGEIILDISGEEKKNLTVEGLVKKFYDVNDEVLLSHE
ncbi:MAG: ABC transporter ATP-binding protein [Spirochaetae bacterium HGW-Spirochaetae-5]|nr:MAG: ABC transporter ATP-binding protein [Spirochaetae bacterium HGW-Spirochaetae-5]